MGDEFFAAGVDEEAHEVGAHVVAAEVGEGFGKVGFVEVDLLGERVLEMMVRMTWVRFEIRRRRELGMLTSTRTKPSKSFSGFARRVPSGPKIRV